MKKYQHVAVLYGGISGERAISLASGEKCGAALESAGYRVTYIDAQADLPTQLLTHKPEACFIALHGTFGEDGTVQGLLEIMGMPYTHSRVLASAIGMNKFFTNNLFKMNGLPVAKGGLLSQNQLQNLHTQALPYGITAPFVLKPADGGSSIGVVIVRNQQEFNYQNLPAALSGSAWPMIEQYIPGRELCVSVLDGKALAVTEIVVGSGAFYDYDQKYSNNGATHQVPANISPTVAAYAMHIAAQCYTILGCHSVCRVDFRYNEQAHEDDSSAHGLYILEVNTHPGMTNVSLLPEQAAYCGISYTQLVCQLMEAATCLHPQTFVA